jgi:hypothetical protein
MDRQWNRLERRCGAKETPRTLTREPSLVSRKFEFAQRAWSAPGRDDIAALQFSPMQRALSACDLAAGHAIHGANGKDWKFMSNENAAGNQTYMIVAALLMVGLLTFGMLHTFGVFR